MERASEALRGETRKHISPLLGRLESTHGLAGVHIGGEHGRQGVTAVDDVSINVLGGCQILVERRARRRRKGGSGAEKANAGRAPVRGVGQELGGSP